MEHCFTRFTQIEQWDSFGND